MLCRYMAPEVLSSQVGPASDVWSVGVMAHQLLTGRFPFDDKRNPLRPSVTKIWCVLVMSSASQYRFNDDKSSHQYPS